MNNTSLLTDKPLAKNAKLKRLINGLIRDAFKIRFFRNPQQLKLPPVMQQSEIPDETLFEFVELVDRQVAKYIFWRRQRCFYRCFVIATILREEGLPIILNFGYTNLFSKKRNRSHCWMTLNKAPFFERSNVTKDFPEHLGESQSATIEYWVQK